LLCLDLQLTILDGILLFILLVSYMAFLIYRTKSKKGISEEIEQPSIPIWQAFLYIIIASFGLYFGAELLVKSAQNIALSFGVSERIIGLTVLAFGTSVPELATSVIAAVKKQMDISVGNIIGSNIFNILGVLGVTSIVEPINVNRGILDFDIFFMIGISVLLFLTMLPLSNGKIKRFEGALLLLFYVIYIGLLFVQ
ncbi:MAG: sodium:calcium antiporter, partial [Flavobacteriaceae bacterium]|nr:sodium:calcium antiporter [Flavobacteriaceae bacterium]